MMSKKLLKSGLAVMFGLAVLGMVGILTGSIDLGSVGSYQLSNIAVVLGALSLAGAMALHGRPLGTYQNWELALASAAGGLVIVIYLGEPIALIDMIERSSPWTEMATAALAYAGLWVVAFGGSSGGANG